MHCPYCQTPAFETTPHCPRCGFSLERVEAFFGVMPRLEVGISDLAGLFCPRDIRRIREAIANLVERFPQVAFSIVTTELKPEQPLMAFAFWIFNRGGICVGIDRGGRSRDILLTLDSANARASLMIGYGLEPFVTAAHLQSIVNRGAADFTRHQWVDGVVAVVDETARALGEIASRLGAAYGLDMAVVRRVEDPASRPKVEGVY